MTATSAPATSLKPDGIGSVIGMVSLVLGLTGVAAKIGLTANGVSMVLGALLGIVTGIRAWWEGMQSTDGGSMADPAGAVAAAGLVVLGAFGVPAELLTADAMLTLVSGAFTLGASIRVWWRSRVPAPPMTLSEALDRGGFKADGTPKIGK